MDRSEKIKILDNVIFNQYENARQSRELFRKVNEISRKEKAFLNDLSEDKVKEYRVLNDLIENYHCDYLSDQVIFTIGFMLDLFGK